MKPVSTRLLVFFLLVLGVPACNRQAPATNAGRPVPVPSQAPAAKTDSPAIGADVVEATPDYVIGISYPPTAGKYPALAVELRRYADAARSELMQAVKGRELVGNAASPYDLSLSFTDILDSPALVAVAADGTSYTGGAHGAPLLARFVWLPQQQRLLTARALVSEAKGWGVIASNVREQLKSALSQRADADELPPGERAELVKNGGRMIDEGTEPKPENFAMFEPVLAASGKVSALRFVFAPYQVGPYSDGMQTVEIPAAVLLPHVAPEFRDLFESTPGGVANR